MASSSPAADAGGAAPQAPLLPASSLHHVVDDAAIALDFRRTRAEYERLYETADPPQTPYASKYEGRDLLLNLLVRLQAAVTTVQDSAAPSTSSGSAGTDGAGAGAGTDAADADAAASVAAHISSLRDLQALVHGLLGVNYVQTEENQSGEGHLLHAFGWLAQRFSIARGTAVPFRAVALSEAAKLSGLSGTVRRGEGEGSEEGATGAGADAPRPAGALSLDKLVGLACGAVECVNYLALLYSGWGNHPRALRYLRLGKRIQRKVRSMQDAHYAALTALKSSPGVGLGRGRGRGLGLGKPMRRPPPSPPPSSVTRPPTRLFSTTGRMRACAAPCPPWTACTRTSSSTMRRFTGTFMPLSIRRGMWSGR
jgi:hypothetical protein